MISIQEMVQDAADRSVEDFMSRGVGLGTSKGESQITIDVTIRRIDDDFPKRLEGKKKRWGSSIIGTSSVLYVWREK